MPDRQQTMWSVARRPRWIASLLLSLAIAAGFAGLGQWQLSRSVTPAQDPTGETEVVVPLESVTEPGKGVTSTIEAQRVRVDATELPGDRVVVADRLNRGRTGYWLTAHAVTGDGASLAVALGWAATKDEADAARNAPLPQTLEGRYLPSEPPQEGHFESGQLDRMSVAALINIWATPPQGVYTGYLVSSTPPPGLERIDSPRPSSEVSVNWLNIFYAIEWAVFAGFAVYFWYRLVRDTWEREQEDSAELN